MARKIKISLSSGITVVGCDKFQYLYPYLQKAIDQFKDDAKYIPSKDRRFGIPYTVYSQFISDFDRYDHKQKKSAVIVYFNNIPIGHLTRNEKLFTHISNVDYSKALECTDKGSTAMGDDYYFTRSGMLLHKSNFDSTYI